MKNNSESFSNYLYKYSKKYPSTAAHVPGAQGEMRSNQQKILSQNKPAKIDEFIFMQPNRIITRNT
jgi:hypothetical protein